MRQSGRVWRRANKSWLPRMSGVGHYRLPLLTVMKFDKLAANYLAFVQLASIRLWLRVSESTS
jgi:transposase